MEKNLFARGVAELAEDEGLAAEPLREFEESGGRLMCEGDRFPLDAYFFKAPE